MRLLGDVCLIESEKLAPPTVGTSTRANQLSQFEVREYGDYHCCTTCSL